VELKRLHPEDYEEKFESWRAVVAGMHANSVFTGNREPAWTPAEKPLRESRVALLTTAGAHLRSQAAFDLADEHGDWSYRIIPGDTDVRDIAVSHAHYDTTSANEDPNVVLPLDALRTLVEQGKVGAASPVHIGMMVWVPDGRPLQEQTGPAVAAVLEEAGVDYCVLTPG
jgi:D-proline reductase (dithiol) PrdB